MKLKYAFALSIATLLGTQLPAHSQEWPQRPITIVVPFPAGGNTDSIARLTAERLTKDLGQNVVVDNRPGAGGAIAAQAVQRADPDGYTLFMAAMPVIAILPKIQDVQYDPVRDFTPITIIGSNPFALAVNSSVPATSIKELVTLLKKNDGKMNYASGGTGSVSHLSAALFLQRAGANLAHIAYKGDTPAMVALMGGEVAMYFGNLSAVGPQSESGKIRMLAVSGKERSPLFPNVPTIAEVYPGFQTLTWNGLMAPRNTPKAIVDRIATAVGKAAKDKEFVDRLSAIGVDVVANTPEEFADTIQSDLELWNSAVAAAKLKG